MLNKIVKIVITSFTILAVFFIISKYVPVNAQCTGGVAGCGYYRRTPSGCNCKTDPYCSCECMGDVSYEPACNTIDNSSTCNDVCASYECSYRECTWTGATPVPTSPPPVCSYGPWSSGSCGSPCASDERLETRTVNPAGCAATSRCVTDSSCTGGGCSCNAWTNGACGDGTTCPFGQRNQTRSCNPAGCSNESRCVADAACPACSCTGWVDDICGGVPCPSDQMRQVQTCTPAGCSLEEQCVPNPICTPAASCTVSFNSPNYSVDSGLTTAVSATGIPIGGTIDQYEFTIADTGVASICTFGSGPCAPGSGFISGASSIIDLTGQSPSPPTTTITVTARMVDEGASCVAIVPSTVTVNNPSSWWQVKEGDAVSDGAISSAIPPTAYESALIVHDVDEFPGVPTYQGSINPSPPNVSSTNWNTNSSYSAPIPDYAFFEGRVPTSSLINITSSTIDTGVLTSGAPVNGYLWFSYDGAVYGNTLRIEDASGTVNIGGNKVVLFVKNADLEIRSKISLTDGQGFFMAISEGDIRVDPGVGGPQEAIPAADLEGIYIADGQFQTGGGVEQLHVRGSVVGNSKVSLDRNLSDNSLYPGELFEYGVDQIMAYPQDLTPSRLIWREVAP